MEFYVSEIAYSQMNVLIIDDEPFVSKLTSKVLQNLGVENISAAGSGREGLDLLEAGEKPIDLVICDLEMPEMDGFEVIRQIRGHSDERISQVPVLIVSGHSHAKLIQDAAKLGINGYLVKPVKLDALKDKIDTALNSATIESREIKNIFKN